MMTSVSGAGSRISFGLTLSAWGVLFLAWALAGRGIGETLGLLWPALVIIAGLWQWASLRFRPALWPLPIIALGVGLMAFKRDLLSLKTFVSPLGVLIIIAGVCLAVCRARPVAQPVSDADAIDHWAVFGGWRRRLQFSGGRS